MIRSPAQFQPKDTGMLSRVMAGLAEMAAMHRAFLAKVENFDAKIEKIQTIGADITRQARAVEERLNAIAVIQGPPGQQGKPGAAIKGDAGEPAVIDYGFLISEVLDKLPTPKDGVSPIVDEEKLLEALFARIKQKGLKLSDIVGLEETITSFSNRMMNKEPYLHGGGDTVSAGSNITITNTNGTKVISATSSAGTNVRDEVPAGSGTAFTLAHTPTANTLQLFRGGTRQSVVNGDYTIVGAAITLTNTLISGETLTADYSF